MFWILCAALVVVVAVAILKPFLRARRTVEPAAAYDLRVYQDQLREVGRDLERGVINEDDAQRLRTEIGRKVLEADRRLSGASGRGASGATIGAAVLLGLALAAAVGIYLREGSPGQPDQPLAQRIADAQRTYENRPSQASAEAEAPPRPAPPEIEGEYADLVQQLREAVARNPDDPQGLALLASNEARLGNLPAARVALERLIELRGDDARAGELMQLSALMVDAAGGVITPEAEQMLARALQRDPALPQARYLLGLMQIQNGRPDRAFPIWRRLLEEGPENAPWVAPIRASMPELAWLAGQPDYVPPAPRGALPGPDQDAVTAAEDMTEAERTEMIEGMVSGLEARLADQGGSPEEWARLIMALSVLGQADRARLIWIEAQEVFADSPEALATVRAAVDQAGLFP